MKNGRSWMKNLITALVFAAAILFTVQNVNAKEQIPAQEKEWTFLLFLNGHNNLDSFGALNINQMEQVGSTDQVNMVVQWASLKNKKTKRLLVQKDSDIRKVTSPILEDMNQVDMGDYKQLVEFVRWGAKNFPAKKYMITVWNHGNGWQRMMSLDGGMSIKDISNDDVSGNKITTEELGLAMAESAQIIGHKVDIYGSDACLMAMAEVAGEMKDHVNYFVGSEELEPGTGWPYNTWMERWTNTPQASALEVSTFLTEEYLKAYDGGLYGNEEVTFSAMDLGKFDQFTAAISALNTSLANLAPAELARVKTAANATHHYYTEEYKDLGDFMDQLSSQKVMISDVLITDVKTAIKEMVVALGSTDDYRRSHGVSAWIPTSTYNLDQYKARYSKFIFNQQTNWLQFLDAMN